MKRTTPTKEQTKVEYEILDEPLVISTSLINLLLQKSKQPTNALSLYLFYYYTAKRQKTNQPRATSRYTIQGLGIGRKQFYEANKILLQLGLIEKVPVRKKGKIACWYIKVNFVWTNRKTTCFSTVDPTTPNRPTTVHDLNGVESQRCRDQSDEILKVSKTNTLSDIKLTSSLDEAKAASTIFEKIKPSHFDKFWNIYPRKVDKGKAKTKWDRLCKQKDRPTWSEIRKAIKNQTQTERWQDKMFIPHPTTWLNNSRWLDDPTEMKLNKSYNTPTNSSNVSNADPRPEWMIRKFNEMED